MTNLNLVTDTSFLMNNSLDLIRLVKIYNIIIPMIVVKELDGLKTSDNVEKSISARKALAILKENKQFILFDDEYKSQLLNCEKFINDDYIVACAKYHNAELATYDFGMELKACSQNINCIKNNEIHDEYNGYRYIKLTNDEMADFYSNLNVNFYNCYINEYIILKNQNNEIVDKLRWDGTKFIGLHFKTISDKFNRFEKVKALNVEQELLIDLLFNDDIPIKLVTGKYGSGKTLFSSMASISMIDSGKYDSIVYLRNNYGVKDTKDIGALPNQKYDKLLPYLSPLSDHVGGEEGLKMLINEHKLEVEHLGFIRGRNFENKIILVNESENLTKAHVQLIISRMAKNTILIFDGDNKQIDNFIFEKNNGLSALTTKLKGNSLFGFVRLSTCERSNAAKLADCLD